MDIIAIGVANNSGGGGGGTPTDAYSKTETDALLKNKVGFAEYKDNKISLYDSSSKDKIIGEIDLPVDMVVDQIKTKFSQKFKFDSTTYPDTENPNLDGKPVLVLAIKTSATADTFSFLNMESLVDVYTGGTTKSAIISVDPETGVITNVVRISAETGNKIVQKNDGLFVPNQTAADVSYSNTTSKLKATTTQAAIDETLGVANSKYSKPETGIPSTDMAQAVKDSLGKADTALQAADKTELQDAIDGVDEAKLDKTAVLSDFSSSELTNKVLSAQLSLDTFTKKVTTESANNNTRIVPVPEDVDCFAGIGMIGGKTQKVVQIGVIQTNPSVVQGISRTAEGTMGVKFTGTCTKTDDYTYSNTESKAIVGHKYCCTFTGSMPAGCKIEGSSDAINNTIIKTATTTNVDANMIIPNGTVLNNVIYPMTLDLTAMFGAGKEPTIEECRSMFTEYIPNGYYLWNAPVTEITSDKNIFDDKLGLYVSNTGGGNGDATYTDGTITTIKIDSGYPVISSVQIFDEGKHTISFKSTTSTNRIFVHYVDSNGNNISSQYKSNPPAGLSYNSFYDAFYVDLTNDSIFINAATKFKFGILPYVNGASASHIQVEKGESATSYEKRGSNTIKLSDVYGNLEEIFPDYGASMNDNVYNYLDLEEMIYHHKVKTIHLGDYDYTDTYGVGRWAIRGDKIPAAKIVASYDPLICDLLTSDKNVIENTSSAPNMTAYFYAADNSLLCKMTDVTTAAQAKAKLANAVLNYELKNEELIPLSSILPPIHVEPNGTIEFVNEHNLDVPTKTIYKKTI